MNLMKDNNPFIRPKPTLNYDFVAYLEQLNPRLFQCAEMTCSGALCLRRCICSLPDAPLVHQGKSLRELPTTQSASPPGFRLFNCHHPLLDNIKKLVKVSGVLTVCMQVDDELLIIQVS